MLPNVIDVQVFGFRSSPIGLRSLKSGLFRSGIGYSRNVQSLAGANCSTAVDFSYALQRGSCQSRVVLNAVTKRNIDYPIERSLK